MHFSIRMFSPEHMEHAHFELIYRLWAKYNWEIKCDLDGAGEGGGGGGIIGCPHVIEISEMVLFKILFYVCHLESLYNKDKSLMSFNAPANTR